MCVHNRLNRICRMNDGIVARVRVRVTQNTTVKSTESTEPDCSLPAWWELHSHLCHVHTQSWLQVKMVKILWMFWSHPDVAKLLLVLLMERGRERVSLTARAGKEHKLMRNSVIIKKMIDHITTSIWAMATRGFSEPPETTQTAPDKSGVCLMCPVKDCSQKKGAH